jgi:hypothetical protein
MSVHSEQRAKLAAADELLRGIAEKYYMGAKAFHICAQAGSPDRAHWHVRLKTLAQIGNQLADALVVTRPDWKTLFYTAHRYRNLDHNPFRATATPPEQPAPPAPPEQPTQPAQPALRGAVARARLRVVQ